MSLETDKTATVFVGNLSYSTTADEVRIIQRFGRSKGFGFVTVNSSAVDRLLAFNNKEFNERPLKIEVAVPMESKVNIELIKEPRERKPRKPRQKAVKKDVVETEKKEVAEVAPAAEKEKEPKKPKQRKPRKTEAKEVPAASESNPAEAKKSEGKPVKSSAKPERPPRDLTPSDTVLFIRNIPFSVTSEQLKEVFESDGIERAQIVQTRGNPKKGVQPRSKGYGFVQWKTQEQCNNAMQKFEGALLDGRAILIRRAYADVKLE